MLGRQVRLRWPGYVKLLIGANILAGTTGNRVKAAGLKEKLQCEEGHPIRVSEPQGGGDLTNSPYRKNHWPSPPAHPALVTPGCGALKTYHLKAEWINV